MRCVEVEVGGYARCGRCDAGDSRLVFGVTRIWEASYGAGMSQDVLVICLSWVMVHGPNQQRGWSHLEISPARGEDDSADADLFASLRGILPRAGDNELHPYDG